MEIILSIYGAKQYKTSIATFVEYHAATSYPCNGLIFSNSYCKYQKYPYICSPFQKP